MKKIGFWRWLLLKIWKGIKSIPKLMKFDPAVEMFLAIVGIAFVAPLLSILNVFMALLAWLAFMLLVTHSIYRMEMEGDC